MQHHAGRGRMISLRRMVPKDDLRRMISAGSWLSAGIPSQNSMRTPNRSFARTFLLPSLAAILITPSCTKQSIGQASTTDLQLNVSVPFRFVAYGDSRFHDPTDTDAANP